MIRFLTTAVLILCLGSFHTSCKSHKPYNPYLDAKIKPGERQRRDDAKIIKKGNKHYKKKEESSRKHLFGRKHAPSK